MDLGTLLIASAVLLTIILVILLIVWALRPAPRVQILHKSDEDDLRKIKNEIEHEIEEDTMHEITPLKRARKKRGRPRRQSVEEDVDAA